MKTYLRPASAPRGSRGWKATSATSGIVTSSRPVYSSANSREETSTHMPVTEKIISPSASPRRPRGIDGFGSPLGQESSAVSAPAARNNRL